MRQVELVLHFSDVPRALIGVIIFLFLFTPALAQEKQLVQIKTFDQELKPLGNLSISINEKPYVTVNAKGVAFVELTENDLPVKSVAVRNEELEAASWNYSKGTLEITIRKKSYQVITLFVKTPGSQALAGVEVLFNGKKQLTLRSDAQGKIELLLAIDEKISSADQFRINNHRILQLALSANENVLTVEPIVIPPVAEVPAKIEEQRTDYFKDFDLSKIDSIQSLTAFHAIFKNYSVSDMNPEVKRKLDEKLNELVQALKDSLQTSAGRAFIGSISDSSFVTDDIRILIDQATVESQILEEQREDVYEKISLINDKIAAAGDNLDEATRTVLLSDLTRLERLLAENESRFYRNQNDYRSILDAIKEKFFQIDVLETKLSESEAQRLEEQRVFRQRLLTILSIALGFAILVVLLVYFAIKLRRRKKDLEVANGEVRRINENLENLVNERTLMLKETNRELDLFLYKASHDLRSPVTSIIGLCNIASHLPNNESKELFERAGETAQSMDKLLKKLRIISEVNQPGNFSAIDLLPMVEDIRSRFRGFIEQHNINFVIDCPADLNFYSNATLTEAMLLGLLENAFFYSTLKGGSKPKVEFHAALNNNKLEFSVYDNGNGIDHDIRANIFDMFFKGTELSKGNGLGLYIVDKSIQALKGNITLDTEVNAYTRFVVNIPMKPAFTQKDDTLVDIPLPDRRVFAEAR